MKWETVIGLEVHAELATKTKIFCGCPSEFGAEANTHICEICTGMPGTLPVLNEKVVEFAVKTGLALNCEITQETKFDRKNYFYPDLPKAYQISQLYLPICRNGFIEIDTPDGEKKIGIHEIHMEEDAGKLIHDDSENRTLIDFNRCGVPLLEIVSEADLRNDGEVIAYVEKLRKILQYIGVCDCKMQEGSLRVDVNLSVKPENQTKLGTRTEMKNLNSFHEIRRAVAYESKRQIELLESGERVLQQTRRWDNSKGVSIAMRTKEQAEDYKYFPEPDLPCIFLSDEYIDAIKSDIPELPDQKMKRYTELFKLSEYDSKLITADIHLASCFEAAAQLCGEYKETANWVTGELLRLLKEHNISTENIPVPAKSLAAVIKMVKENKINRTVAKQVFEKAFTDGIDPEKYVEENSLSQFTDAEKMREVIARVIEDNKKSVNDYKSGKLSAFGYITGQAMKAFSGRASAQEIKKIIIDILNKGG